MGPREFFKLFSAYWGEPLTETFRDAAPPFEPFFPDSVVLPRDEYTVAEGCPVTARFDKDRLPFYRANMVVRELADLPSDAKDSAHYNFYLRLERAAAPNARAGTVHYFKIRKPASEKHVVDGNIRHWNDNHMGMTGKYLSHFIDFVPRESWRRNGVPLPQKNYDAGHPHIK